MGDERVYGSSEITALLHNEINACSSEVLESLLIPNSSPSFHGEFEAENNEELFDGFWRQSGKKRRLSVDQVQILEKNFEVENKLEPERKIQLAKELGLQPRQVAIWFQNRRARYKTKQLEKDFSSLKTLYENLKSDYEILTKEKEKLKTEVHNLKEKLAIRQKGKQNSSTTEVGKQEEASSAKIVAFDSSESSHNVENQYSSMADSCHEFEAEHSDYLSQDEEDNLSRNLLPTCFPKLESCYYDDEPPSGCSNLGFQIEDQALGFWPF